MCGEGTTTKIEPEIPSAAQDLWGRLMGGMDEMGKPYGGSYTAPLSEQEQMGLKLLSDYGVQGGENNALGMGMLNDTISGKYLNPSSNPYMQKMGNMITEQAKRALGGQANQMGAMFQKSGMGGGSGERMYKNKLISDTNQSLGNSLAGLYGQNYQTERGRQMQAIPMLSQMGMEPLQRAQALMQGGALPRSLAQNDLSSQYQDWLRTTNSPYQYGMSLMQNMPLQYPQYSYQQGGTEQFMQLLPYLMQGAGSLMGGWGALA